MIQKTALKPVKSHWIWFRNTNTGKRKILLKDDPLFFGWENTSTLHFRTSVTTCVYISLFCPHHSPGPHHNSLSTWWAAEVVICCYLDTKLQNAESWLLCPTYWNVLQAAQGSCATKQLLIVGGVKRWPCSSLMESWRDVGRFPEKLMIVLVRRNAVGSFLMEE